MSGPDGMDDDALHLAELLCTRLCHDLAGPVGGAAAGVELLGEEGGLPDDVAGLLGASVDAAGRHLRRLRAALGRGGPATAAAELRALAEGFVATGGGQAPRLEWRDDAADNPLWGQTHGKLVLNLVLAGRDVLPLGGTLAVAVRRAAPWRVTLAAQGRLGSAVEDVLAGLAAATAAGLSPRSAQACFLARLTRLLGGHLDVRRDDGGFNLTVEEQKSGAPGGAQAL